MASGLDALILSLEAFEFKKGSEIIVPSNTYVATILAIIRAGFKPVLIEPDITTYNIDPTKIEEKITKKTKAILPVHLYGKCADMGAILSIANKYDLKVLEDSAQAHGARFKNKKSGTFGSLGAFSFYPTKNLGAMGDGGAIITNNKELKNKITILRNYGSNKKHYNKYIGYNSRLDEIQACFLSVKLKHLDKINEHKRGLASIYLKGLNNIFIKPIVEKNYFDIYHIFNIRSQKRDKLKKYLLKNGIETQIHYPLAPYKQEAMKGMFKGKYPISEEIHNTTLSLPISYFHTKKDIYKIVEIINRFKV